jgi:ferredoxin
MPPEKPQWAELFTEVVTSGLCTGCSACVIACPYDVLGYDDTDGHYKPFHVLADGGPDNCTHGLKGCTLCTRACPRFRTWEPEIENPSVRPAPDRRGGRGHRAPDRLGPGHRSRVQGLARTVAWSPPS